LAINVSVTPKLEKSVGGKVNPDATTPPAKSSAKPFGFWKSDHDCAAQLADFNGELGRRRASLDRDEAVQAAEAHRRLQRKSEQRRKSGA